MRNMREKHYGIFHFRRAGITFPSFPNL